MQNPNQFSQTPELGQLDLSYSPNTISCQVKSDEASALVAGQAVKIVDSATGVPEVTAVTSNADEVFGFVAYSFKQTSYEAGDAIEIASELNVVHLEANGAIARGAQVCIDEATVGHVIALTAGRNIVGYALDKAADGELLRVMLSTPSFSVY